MYFIRIEPKFNLILVGGWQYQIIDLLQHFQNLLKMLNQQFILKIVIFYILQLFIVIIVYFIYFSVLIQNYLIT
jgi:hypothetical protein